MSFIYGPILVNDWSAWISYGASMVTRSIVNSRHTDRLNNSELDQMLVKWLGNWTRKLAVMAEVSVLLLFVCFKYVVHMYQLVWNQRLRLAHSLICNCKLNVQWKLRHESWYCLLIVIRHVYNNRPVFEFDQTLDSCLVLVLIMAKFLINGTICQPASLLAYILYTSELHSLAIKLLVLDLNLEPCSPTDPNW